MDRPPPPVTFAPSIPQDLHEPILEASHFATWFRKAQTHFDLRSVHVRDVMMFGRWVGFVVLEADAWHEGRRMPCYAVLRGPTVSIMPVIRVRENSEEAYVVLVNEARLPAGQMVTAMPAGMVDDETADTAALRELQEETGIDLTHGVPYRLREEPVFLSPGGSDEQMTLYAVDIILNRKDMDRIQGRHAGLASEHESTQVMVVPLAAVPELTPNAHCLLSWHLYQQRQSRPH
ncbi:NUDIX domain-containing protein [Gluconobacter morbifer]|uniref:GDP-mannose pyrophosphatase n=1 Tax=Gluconobacter morbifer G707 TaxID=1088869 RepID=G6XHI4_9PROT|nr:NUDIX domain-containing protein [Gluconobacter morbifer]EHH69642.1 ADP-ribose pyrophosphatase [Gluconobacter morbifer G707]